MLRGGTGTGGRTAAAASTGPSDGSPPGPAPAATAAAASAQASGPAATRSATEWWPAADRSRISPAASRATARWPTTPSSRTVINRMAGPYVGAWALATSSPRASAMRTRWAASRGAAARWSLLK